MTGRVLQLLGPSTGGIRQVVAATTLALRSSGWDVVTAGPAGVLEGLVAQDAIVAVPTGLLALRRVAADVDLVHAHGLKAGWMTAIARPRTPLVVSVHNVVLDEVAGRRARVLRAMEGMLPRVADRVVALSPAIADRFGGRAVVLPPAATAPEPQRSARAVRAAYRIGDDDPLVVTVARLHPQKDLPSLLEAMTVVARVLPRARLVVVGEGPDESALRSMVTQLGLDAVVTFAGARFPAADELAAADVAVTSSRWESGPLALLEAMQLGRPVVSTDVGFAPELIIDGLSGRLVPVAEPAALARAIIEVLVDPTGAAAMGVAGRQAAELRAGPDAIATATEAIYREVIG